MATKLTPLEVLQKRKREMSKNPCRDKRKAKGTNQYTVVVISCYEEIEGLIAKGDTLSGIFRELQDKGFFDDNADDCNFRKAFALERKRRNFGATASHGKATKSVVPQQTIPLVKDKGIRGIPVTQDDENAPEGARFMRDGEYYAIDSAGKEIRIPPGKVFVRDRLRHISADGLEPESDKNEDDGVNFSDLPQYIQDSMNESKRNGTALQDANKHRKMIAEWQEQKKLKNKDKERSKS